MSYKIVEIPLNIGIGLNGFTPEIHVLKFEVETRSNTPLIPRKTKPLSITFLGPGICRSIFKGAKNRESSPHNKFILADKNKSNTK